MGAIRRILNDLNLLDVVPVVAVGNDKAGNIRLPAELDETLSVGAIDYNHDPAPFSGGGVSSVTGSPKPDVAGFGVEVLSSYERDIDNQSWYSRMSGTSMAAPYVTGILALLASADKTLKGDRLRNRLLETIEPLSSDHLRVGRGLARFVF